MILETEPSDDTSPTPWAAPGQEVLMGWDVKSAHGLSPEEAVRRKSLHGPNLLREHSQRSNWSLLWGQFKSLIVALLLAAAVVAFAFGDTMEGWAVLVVVLLNTAIGFVTERRAVRSMEALHTLSKVTARVRRGGQESEIPAEDLVPGDIVVVEGGDVVTADLRLFEASRLQVDESTLTGESLPVRKDTEPVPVKAPVADRTSMLYKGTAVTRGAGSGVVVATGMGTELGEISALVAEAEGEATPLEERLEQLGRRLIGVTLAVTALVTLSGSLTGKDLVLMIETGLALAVAAIPEGLPIVATIALAQGMRRMAARNALINRLASVETLGSTSVIFTDKTGTLTENRLTATHLALSAGTFEIDPNGGPDAFRLGGQSIDPLSHPVLRVALKVGVLCNDASMGDPSDDTSLPVGDPLEVALLTAGAKAGLHRRELTLGMPEVREEAFDAEVKMMATFHESDGAYLVAAKGAPEAVLAASSRTLTDQGDKEMTHQERSSWLRRNEDLAATGLRVLALAMKSTATSRDLPYQGLVFIGLVGLMDPPRSEVHSALEQCRRAGIEIVMVTGDQAVTALVVGQAVGLVQDQEQRVVLGAEMKPPHLLNREEKQELLQSRLFARVSPRQKLDLIELHQRAGHIVAMTGDGVNDAPALKKADIGIAMGMRGTQVAQEAADMVLQDDSFATIVAAVKEGRAIFENIRTFVLYLMSCNVSEVMVVGAASLMGSTLPILPLQILFLNLVTDVFPALALGIGPGNEDLMNRTPRNPEEPVLGRQQWLWIGFYGIAFTGSVLGALLLAEIWLDKDRIQAVTISFLTLAFAQLWHVFNMRSSGSGVFRNEITQNPFVWAALLLCSALILLAVYIPTLAQVLGIRAPDLAGWSLVIGMSLVPLGLGQAGKLLFSKLD